MENFSYCNPVKMIFGKGQIKALGLEIPPKSKVLFLYGGGSIKKNGVYEQVKTALQEFSHVEFSGVEPNPEFVTLMRAVDVCKKEGINFVLAVGGGSVVDGAKFVAAAVNYAGDPLEILQGKAGSLVSALPLGVVLTLPATGSEMNCFSVVSVREQKEKLAFGNPLVYPKFSVLDPETTFSLPHRQIGNGIVDAFVHTTEQYLTFATNAPLQERFAEGVLQTLIDVGPKVLQETHNYDHRANMMWAASMALCGVFGVGVPQDWATHMIGHELTALYGLDHAQTLAIVLPNLLTVCKDQKRDKLLQYAARVWGISEGPEDQAILSAIDRTKAFFEQVGVATKLRTYEVDRALLQSVPARLTAKGMLPLGEKGNISADIVGEILELCW